jgi:hypothetical protein
MSDFDDNLITGAFDDFSDAAAPHVKIAGTTAVRATVRHRRIVRATALSVLGALLIAVPTATYAVSSHGSKSPPTLAAASPSVSVSTAPSPSVLPSAAPSESPSTSPSTPPPPVSKAGEITIAELTAVKVTIPAWTNSYGECTSGKMTLVKPQPRSTINHNMTAAPGLEIGKVVYTNLDGDSAPETAVLVGCQYGEAAADMVIAFDRNSSGKIVTLGKVAEGHIWSMTARSGGGVTLNVSDSQSCCSTPNAMEDHQTRSYAWTGAHFAQVAGPTSFIAHKQKIVLKVSATVTWSKPKNSVYTGVVTVTIKNPGDITTAAILVEDSTQDKEQTPFGPETKLLHALAPGASESASFTVHFLDNSNAFGQTGGYVDAYEMGSDTLGQLPVMAEYPWWS